MAKKRIKRVIRIIFSSFDLREYCPEDKGMKSLMNEIQHLEYDGVTKGKENMRNDFYKLRNDFLKSVLDAKEKTEKERLFAQ